MGPPDPALLAAQDAARAAWAQVFVAILQAIGAIVVACVAIYVPWKINRQDSQKKERARFIEGREMANQIEAAFADWLPRVAFLASMARSDRVVDVFDRYEQVFQVPAALSSQIGRLPVLGEAALPIQEAIHLVGESDDLWNNFRDAAKGDLEDDDLAREAINRGYDAIFRLKALLLVASQGLSPFFSEKFSRFAPPKEGIWDYGARVEVLMRDDILRFEDRTRARQRRDQEHDSE
jgi:hypothetical protein